ncbi:TXLNB [Symbiodinium microadriaticum]|nr:TXLNB [Symbiodinium microadriaticum]
MGKKGKTKKPSVAAIPESCPTNKIKYPPVEKKTIERIDNSFLAKLNETQLRNQFNAEISVGSSSPEEGIQAARDLFVDVTKIRRRLHERVNILQTQQILLDAEENKYRALLQSESESTRLVVAQVANLQVLKGELTKKRDQLVHESEAKAEEERRERHAQSEELSVKIAKVSSKLEEQGKERLQQARENEDLKSLLRAELDKYSAAEANFEEKMEHYAKQIEEKTRLFESQTKLLEVDRAKCTKYEAQIKGMIETERGLRAKVAEYSLRFEGFQESLNKSNSMFGEFKKKIDQLTKAIKQHEQENASLAKKQATSVETIRGLRAEQEVLVSEGEKTKRQTDTLHTLITALEKENEETRQKIMELEGATSPPCAV